MASQQAIRASELDAASMAKKRALSWTERPAAVEIPRHARFHWSMGWSPQNLPMSVCSAVRVLFVTGPSAFTSS